MRRRPRIALICSAHGFGHVTRQIAIGEALIELGAEPVYWTAAPAFLVRESLPQAEIVTWAPDVGLAQRDSLSEDVERTLELLEQRCSDAAVERLAAALRGFDGAVVDIAPAALEACRRAGVPAVAVGNFDWAWLYRHYPALTAWAERFRAWQAPHTALRLLPGPELTGFAHAETFGLVGRRRPAHRLDARRTVLVSFGGFGLEAIERLLPPLEGVTYVISPPMRPLPRPDCVYVEGVPYPALVAGADAILTKAGYGILAEASLAGTPIAYVPRGSFPEAAYLEQAMAARGDVPVLDGGGLAAALETLWSRPRPAPADPGEALRVAARLLQQPEGERRETE